tara:strand:- start:356 stop:1033 length:678 start_codon:yes stop_codon:yes gene_type:complete
MIVITGATRGLGNSIALNLKERGYEVLGLARNSSNEDFEILQCDVSDYDAVKDASKKVKKLGEPIECVINAAGVASMNMAVTTDKNTVKKIIQTNLSGTIFVSQLFAPILLRQKQGSFINFSTIAVPLALKGESVYVASKAGVEGFTKSFAREMADFNVRVNCIAPGPIKTDLLKGVSDEQIKDIVSRQILQKDFKKSDICDLVQLLLDQRSSSLSGQIFNVGGV